MGDLRSFTIETFEPLIGESFRIHVDDASPIEMELISAQPYDEQHSGDRTPFSIVFRGPSQPLLVQKTYGVEHALLGSFDLFIVPIGPDEAGLRYEAVFG
jgi:hypothetical protein